MAGRILIVEDNETNALLFSDVLTARGYAVDVAPDGERAFALLERERRYDLILLDIHLPGLDGLSVARAIRSTPEFDDVPIVGLSALVTEREIQEAYAAGFDDYLTKPVEIKTLVEAVERYVRRGRKAASAGGAGDVHSSGDGAANGT
ncbi:MAG: response regulator [Hydrogenibacillus sp.]|nr:response regulator [Hydrogenibacillus sp.]